MTYYPYSCCPQNTLIFTTNYSHLEILQITYLQIFIFTFVACVTSMQVEFYSLQQCKFGYICILQKTSFIKIKNIFLKKYSKETWTVCLKN